METHIIIASHLCIYSWALAYGGIIYRGFKDRTYGMPIVALVLNLAWEVVFAVVIPPHGSADSQLVPFGALKAQIVFLIWATLDVIILYTYFRFGFKYFEKFYGIGRGQWIAFTLIMLVFAFFIMATGGEFFRQFDVYFHHDQIEGAKLIAFVQNAFMSIAFIAMYYQRGSVEGQSFTIAWAKWIGTSMTGGIVYLRARPDEWHFVGTFIIMIFLADVFYMIVMYRALRRQGINPWIRL